MTGPHLVVGLGVTGRAVAGALLRRGEAAVAVDDRPGEAARQAAAELGLDLVEAPDRERLTRLVRQAAAVVPTPGLPAGHAVFEVAARAGVPVLSGLDLAARWDDRPLLAVTGRDGGGADQSRIWRHQSSGQVAVGNVDDPVVCRHLETAPGRHVAVGLGPGSASGPAYRVAGGVLVTDGGEPLCPVDELPGAVPAGSYDLRHALAASATALHGGGTLTGVASALRSFGGFPPRLTLVGDAGGVPGDRSRRSEGGL